MGFLFEWIVGGSEGRATDMNRATREDNRLE